MHLETVKRLEVLKPDRVVDLRDAICPHPLNVIRDTIRALDDDAVLLAISTTRQRRSRTRPGSARGGDIPTGSSSRKACGTYSFRR